MNDISDKITITGTKDGIEKAEHEIRITSDEQSKKAFERVNVPKIYHPFIVGALNEKLNQLINETGARINVPPPSVNKDEIVIAGEKEGVLAAKARIEAIYKEMEKKCTTVSVEVNKSQHKYVIGPRGSTIAEILQKTGVSVEMPPSESSTGTITLRGPHDKLGIALGIVYSKANSVSATDVDAPAWIHKYIIGRKGANIKEITKDSPKVHVEFTDKENKIKIEGPPEEVEKTKEKIDSIVKDYVSKLIFMEINVDPKFYKHIIGKNGANVNRLKEETNVIINIDETGLIRIEGGKQGVLKTKQELEDMVKKLENEKEKDVIIEQRHYKNIIGAKGEKIREIRDKFNQVQINFPGPGDKRDIVKIRGPKEDVDKCHKYLQKLVKELNEASYQIEVPIFKQFHKFIIGKGGLNIKKIREETQTKIDLPAEVDKNDVITITGKKENVEEAREKIRKIQDELETIVTEEITIDPKFYNSLIGTKGKLIHSIMEDCGGVTIKFPVAESKSDKVTIRGPKEDVERAKQQLLDLANERQLASYIAEVRAKPQHHKFLIGKNGANIKKIRDSTGARVVFPTNEDEDNELITIIGKKDAVEQAKSLLEASIRDIDNITESKMTVDARHHKHFVARRGEVLHRITDECGGVMISFPRPGVQSDKVVLKGAKDCIEAAKARIEEIITELESMVTIECVIPQNLHRTVMGAKGRKVQSITY
ncbi:K Homology domain containing protein, partial [Oryctes borbonicus]